MAIFGTTGPTLSSSAGDLYLDKTRVDYNFFDADVIEHVSVLTGHKSYPYSRNKSIFQLDVVLTNYSSSEADTKMDALLNNIDGHWWIFPHSDGTASLDVFEVPIKYYITEFVPYYLGNDNNYDAVLITMSPEKNSVLYTVDTELGYGYNFGIRYDYSGW